MADQEQIGRPGQGAQTRSHCWSQPSPGAGSTADSTGYSRKHDQHCTDESLGCCADSEGQSLARQCLHQLRYYLSALQHPITEYVAAELTSRWMRIAPPLTLLQKNVLQIGEDGEPRHTSMLAVRHVRVPPEGWAELTRRKPGNEIKPASRMVTKLQEGLVPQHHMLTGITTSHSLLDRSCVAPPRISLATIKPQRSLQARMHRLHFRSTKYFPLLIASFLLSKVL